MTTYFDLPLWINFDDIKNRASYFADDLDAMDQNVKDSILQWVHDKLILATDANNPIKFKDGTTGGSPGSSQFSLSNIIERTAYVRRMQISLGAWAAAFTIDNPAGTGSLSGVSIDAFSVSNTMAKNNATAEDLDNANQYGAEFTEIMKQRFQTRIMV